MKTVKIRLDGLGGMPMDEKDAQKHLRDWHGL